MKAKISLRIETTPCSHLRGQATFLSEIKKTLSSSGAQPCGKQGGGLRAFRLRVRLSVYKLRLVIVGHPGGRPYQ